MERTHVYRQKSISGKTQKEVLQKMKQALAELDQGTYTEPSKLTVAEWLNTWHRKVSLLFGDS